MAGHDPLATNDRSISCAEQSITRLLLVIDRMTKLGRDTSKARELLAVIQGNLDRLYQQRRELIDAYFQTVPTTLSSLMSAPRCGATLSPSRWDGYYRGRPLP
jgi:cell division FtsZ-interacting protein ZapD